jgi:hypothetical protein
MTPKELYERCIVLPDSWYCDMLDHLPTLREMAKGEVLEIGVHQGVSTSALLLGIEEKGGHLTSVDIREQCGEVFKGHPCWTFLHGDSYSCIPDKNWDLVFIDGSHEYEMVKADMRHVKSIGLLHDLISGFPGVKQAFNEWPGKKEILSEKSYGLGLIHAYSGHCNHGL